MRILIAGGPKTGKTTFASFFTVPVYHTDDLIPLPWDAQTQEVVKWLHMPAPWVIEGCAVARGLREWLKQYAGLPFDHCLYLRGPVGPLTPGQMNMAAGTWTIWKQIKPIINNRILLDDHARELTRRFSQA